MSRARVLQGGWVVRRASWWLWRMPVSSGGGGQVLNRARGSLESGAVGRKQSVECFIEGHLPSGWAMAHRFPR